MSLNKVVSFAIVIVLICLFNPEADAEGNLCTSEGNFDLSSLAKHWWLVAFAFAEEIKISCGRFSVYKFTNNDEHHNKFYGYWSSRNGTSKEYVDLAGELHNYVAVVKGLNVDNEMESIDIIMCNNNTQMIWTRPDPKTYFFLSTTPIGSEKILNKYKFIAESQSLVYQNVNNSGCAQ